MEKLRWAAPVAALVLFLAWWGFLAIMAHDILLYFPAP